VLQNLGLTWAPRWHYSVVIGYDLSRGGFYLNSGKKKLKFMPFKTFHNTWERGGYWAYIAVPPDRLPQLASQDQLFVETAHLERAGQFDPAATSYRNILKRDPDNPQVWFGLGNAWMASHNYAEAEKAYREAIRHTPDKLYLYNNLAHALSQQGKTPTACNLLEDRLHFSSKRLDSRPNKAYWGQLADTYQTLCKKS
jgi:tetratricopeptide (TPR) repeat protein